MATPGISGTLALMLCANNQVPGSTGLVLDTARHFLTRTATMKKINLQERSLTNRATNFAKLSLLCNVGYGDTYGTYPNYIYGWGEVDACAAVRKASGKL